MKTPTYSDDVSEKLDRMGRKYHFFMLVYDLLVVGILILFTYVFFNYSDNHQLYGIIIAISVFFFTCLGFRLGDIYFKDYPYRF